ncbi:MAG: carotenoid biosynthesis protein [Promethearchaeota archaeon]
MQSIKENIPSDQILVIIMALYLISSFIEPLARIGGLFMYAFVIIHGVKRYGPKNMSLFFVITFIISWIFEAMSIETGFPFGNYYYTDHLGFKLGTVPLVIMPSWFMTGYLSWTMGSTFLRNYGNSVEKKDLFLLPFISGFIMLMWDFCLDPIFSNIQEAWIWEEAGSLGYYFGVPISNYFGWYLTIWLIFQIFAIYLYLTMENENIGESKVYWLSPAVIYFALSIAYLISPFLQTSNLDIYWSMFLAAVVTMSFISFLNFILVLRDESIEENIATVKIID